jgi:hypothetical protein
MEKPKAEKKRLDIRETGDRARAYERLNGLVSRVTNDAFQKRLDELLGAGGYRDPGQAIYDIIMSPRPVNPLNDMSDEEYKKLAPHIRLGMALGAAGGR